MSLPIEFVEKYQDVIVSGQVAMSTLKIHPQCIQQFLLM